jgi:hypothetical protein
MPWPTPARRDLRSYLGLPLEQYSLLDPRYISRLPSCDGDDAGGAQGGSSSDECAAQSGESGDKASSSGGGAAAPPVSGSFLLTVPLADIVGLELTPQLVIDVDVDERLGAVGGLRVVGWVRGTRSDRKREGRPAHVVAESLANVRSNAPDPWQWRGFSPTSTAVLLQLGAV